MKFSLPADVDLEEAVYAALGAASVCWESMAGTGVFQSDEASAIGEELVRFVQQEIQVVTDRVMLDLHQRLERAAQELHTLIARRYPEAGDAAMHAAYNTERAHLSEANRLEGKVQGVTLAISYVNEHFLTSISKEN